MGLLSEVSPDAWQALSLLGAYGAAGQGSQGLLAVNQFLGGAKDRALREQLLQAQLAETLAQGEERKANVASRQAEMERQKRVQAGLPNWMGGGFTGGEAVPQTVGGIPMFSQPMGVSPMQARPRGFDVPSAILGGMKPEEATSYFNAMSLGQPKATRQLEVDDGRGGKRIALVDDQGREVAGFAGYTAPVQVNRGDRVDFVKPAPGISLGMNMSPSERDASARGWASNALARERLNMDQANAGAGRAPQGYRFKADGSLEAIPGGPADKQSAATADERKAATLLKRLEGSQAQLSEALTGSPGAAKPEMLAESIRGFRLPVVGGIPGAESIANTLTSENRQRVEAAQLDILDAALTLGTGAAYTKEQLEGYRKSYFPQVGDGPKQVKDKQARLQNVIEAARIAAGRAGTQTSPRVQQGGATGSWDNSNDPLGLRR